MARVCVCVYVCVLFCFTLTAAFLALASGSDGAGFCKLHKCLLGLFKLSLFDIKVDLDYNSLVAIYFCSF